MTCLLCDERPDGGNALLRLLVVNKVSACTTNPAGPSVDVFPAGLEGDVRVKVESLRRRSGQVTAQPET